MWWPLSIEKHWIPLNELLQTFGTYKVMSGPLTEHSAGTSRRVVTGGRNSEARKNSGMTHGKSQRPECSVLAQKVGFFLEMCLTKACLVPNLWLLGFPNSTFGLSRKQQAIYNEIRVL